MRGRRNCRGRAAAAKQKREANKALTQTPAADETFADATATVESSSSTSSASEAKQNDFLSEVIKIEKLDREAIETTEGSGEYILDDIKPDIYEIQQEWLKQLPSQRTEEAATAMSTVNTALTIMPSLQTNIKIECESIVDNYNDDDDAILDVLSSDGNQITNEIVDKQDGKTKTVENAAKKVKISNLYLDTVDIDMQQTDSDEDGYSDIDLDDDDHYEVQDNDANTDPYDPDWLNNSMMLRKKLPNFKDPTSNRSVSSHSHIYYFHSIVDGQTKFFNTLAGCCNKRAIETKGTLVSNMEAITAREMSIFFGLCLQMGSMHFTTLAEYWECQAYHGFNGFSSKMSFERFQAILEVLNFESFYNEDNTFSSEDENEDKFCDLKPFLNFFNNRMESTHNCQENLVLNEPIIYWKGKLNWLNQVKEKFRRNAVKLYHLTEQSGLVLKLIPELESTERREELGRNSKALALQRLDIAKELLKEQFGKGHTVFSSKYYSSYALGLELLNHGTYASGILDSKRFGNSRELVFNKLNKFEFETKYANYIMMLKTRRRGKNSYFFSSDCLAIYYNEMKRFGQLKLVKEITWHLKSAEMLSYILDYQLALERTEIKWDKRLMILVMHIIVLNAFILYKVQPQNVRSTHPDNITFEKYRQKIIALLLDPDDYVKSGWNIVLNENIVNIKVETKQQIEVCRNTPKTNRKASSQLELEKKKIHRPMAIPCHKEKFRKKRCGICYKVGLLNFSQFCCDSCPGMPGLCEEPCFKIWHSKMRNK